MAIKLNGLGMKIDPAELKKVTKLTFIDDSEKEWSPSKEDLNKEWSPEDKEQLKKELEDEDNK